MMEKNILRGWEGGVLELVWMILAKLLSPWASFLYAEWE